MEQIKQKLNNNNNNEIEKLLILIPSFPQMKLLTITFKENILSVISSEKMALHHTKPVNCSSFSKDGQLILTGGFKEFFIWDTKLKGRIKQYPKVFFDEITSVEFSGDGKKMIGSSLDFSWHIYDLATDRMWLKSEYFFYTQIQDTKFSPDSSYLACSAERKQALAIWNIKDDSKKPIKVFESEDNTIFFQIYWNSNGKEIITCTNLGQILFIDFLEMKIIKSLNLGKEKIQFLDCLEELNQLVVAKNNEIQLWNYKELKLIHSWSTNQKNNINGIKFIKKWKLILSQTLDGIRIWDFKGNQLFSEEEIGSLCGKASIFEF